MLIQESFFLKKSETPNKLVILFAFLMKNPLFLLKIQMEIKLFWEQMSLSY